MIVRRGIARHAFEQFVRQMATDHDLLPKRLHELPARLDRLMQIKDDLDHGAQ